MRLSKNGTEANSLKRTYHKPQLEKVQLVPDEAVLAACKTTYFHVTNGYWEEGNPFGGDDPCIILIASCVIDGS